MRKKKQPSQRKTSTRARRTRRKRPAQRGRGIDIQKWLGKTGIEFHWPGYQFMGPGTHLEKRLKRGDQGINRLDRIAKEHDIDYSHANNLQDKWQADSKMIKAIDRLPGKKYHDGTRGQENHASQETFEIVKEHAFNVITEICHRCCYREKKKSN